MLDIDAYSWLLYTKNICTILISVIWKYTSWTPVVSTSLLQPTTRGNHPPAFKLAQNIHHQTVQSCTFYETKGFNYTTWNIYVVQLILIPLWKNLMFTFHLYLGLLWSLPSSFLTRIIYARFYMSHIHTSLHRSDNHISQKSTNYNAKHSTSPDSYHFLPGGSVSSLTARWGSTPTYTKQKIKF